MLIDKTDGLLDEVKAFAAKVGKLDNLTENLDYLNGYACNDGRQTRCHLYRDFAPASFYFVMDLKREDEPDTAYRQWFNGGLIFHGNHDGFGSGSAPTFSVCLTATDGWSIHT